MENLFDVVVDIPKKDGSDQALVQERLAKLLKISKEKLVNLLAKDPLVVKKGIDLVVAEKYKDAIEQTGASCEIVPNLNFSIEDEELEVGENKSNRDTAPSSFEKNPSTSKVEDKYSVNYKSSIKNASDKITSKLGLEKIEEFSLSDFFSETLRRHSPDEVERLLSVGTPETTPKLEKSMSVMPTPWIFFRVLIGTVIAYIVFLFSWKTYHNVHLVPGLIIIGSFAVPFSTLILFFELNTPKNISIIKIFELVVIGGAISLFLSLFIFEITPFLGIFGLSAAGFVEEVGKLAALLFVLRNVSHDRYKYRLNALLLGAAVGTGFAAFESAGYALRIGLMSSNAMIENIQLRGVMSPFAHIAWTAIAASAFWIARKNFSNTWETLKSAQFIKIFCIPVCLHFVWNLPIHGPFMAKYLILGFVAWVVIISFVQSGLKEVSEVLKT